MRKEKYFLLNKINSPDDLKKMPESDMPRLCAEIRRFLVENVCRSGGHLASNLGVVELTVAMHRVFDSPNDRIIFDVGHQSYVHKLLTGRREEFSTLRTPGGLSGFTKRSESEHDAFGAGHSSTSVSAALGFAKADKICGRDSHTVAVLGDGAFTGGMVHEALNNCDRDLNLIIILNENEMSISKNIGGFAKYIANIRASRGYNKAKMKAKNVLSNIPVLYGLARDAKRFVKNSLYSSNYFEEMGLFYMGPGDGNDYATVRTLLAEAKRQGESVIVHLKTEKGKGYAPAETSPSKYHGVLPGLKTEGVNYSKVAGEALVGLAEEKNNVCAITAAMCESTGLLPFKERFADRFFDVGIAEEHALTFSAGLAAAGMRPYFAVYSSFLQRGYDNIIHDIALQDLCVTILIDRASLSGGDGPTHHGIYDVSMMSAVPNMTLYAPMSFESLRSAVNISYNVDGPCAIRYPNDTEHEELISHFKIDGALEPKPDFEKSPETVIITYGKVAGECVGAEKILRDKGIDVGVLLLTQIMPYNDVCRSILPYIKDAKRIVFVEEGIRSGGAGMMIRDTLARMGVSPFFDIIALDSGFAFGEKQKTLYESVGLSSDKIAERIENLI